MPAFKILDSKNVTIKNCAYNGEDEFVDSDERSSINMQENVHIKKSASPLELNGDTLLLVGNGLNYALFDYLKQINQPFFLDTNNFFPWTFVKTPETNNSFLDDLPLLKESIQTNNNFQNDFARVESIIEKTKNILEHNLDEEQIKRAQILLCEIEHYIAIAFSHYHQQMNQLSFKDWEFIGFLKKYCGKMSMVISLNYDLLLESCLNIADIGFKRYGVEKEINGIPILKPHGSIDYETTSINKKVEYPLKSVIHRNNTPLRKLNDCELLLPRSEIDIVPPTQYSEIKNYQWVAPGYEDIRLYGNHIKRLIIFGVSYWSCDREEIDLIIDNIYPNAKAIFINGPRDKNENLQELQSKLTCKLGVKRVKYYSTISDVDENWFFK